MTQQTTTGTGALERKLRILLIDDDNLLTDLISESLTFHGYEIIICNDCPSAIRIYESNYRNIDAIILDMTMPELGGKEAFTALRRVNPDAKVLLASGYCVSEDVQAMLNDGAAGFLQKPFRLAELARQVGKLKPIFPNDTEHNRPIG